MSGIVKYSNSVGSTPAFALIAEGFAEVADQQRSVTGTALPPYSEASECFYTTDPIHGDITGVLVFHTERGYITVELAYVEMSSRLQGLFSLMLSGLKDYAKSKGCSRIYFPTGDRGYLHDAIYAGGWHRVAGCKDTYEVHHGG